MRLFTTGHSPAHHHPAYTPPVPWATGQVFVSGGPRFNRILGRPIPDIGILGVALLVSAFVLIRALRVYAHDRKVACRRRSRKIGYDQWSGKVKNSSEMFGIPWRSKSLCYMCII